MKNKIFYIISIVVLVQVLLLPDLNADKEIIYPKDFRGGVLPVPRIVTLVTFGTPEDANIVTISYMGQISTNKMYVSIRQIGRYSGKMIKKYRKFAINYMSPMYVDKVDFCGMTSGENINKYKATGLTLGWGKFGIPIIKEASYIVECFVDKILKEGDYDVIIGDVKCIIKNKGEYPDCIIEDSVFYYNKRGKTGELFSIGEKLLNSKELPNK